MAEDFYALVVNIYNVVDVSGERKIWKDKVYNASSSLK